MKRKRLLPVASAHGRPIFQMVERDWLRIEAAYGQSIAPPLREQIEDRTRHFLEWANFELTAPPVQKAEKLVNALESSGAKVAKALRDLLASGDAPLYVRQSN